jgi:murein DD-endopeptidase MepM/ murein hydrolase activator NlpD
MYSFFSLIIGIFFASLSFASISANSGSIIFTKIENNNQCISSINYEVNNENYCIFGVPFVDKALTKNIDGFDININFVDYGESRITIKNLSQVNLSENDRNRANKEAIQLRKVLSKYSDELLTNLDFQLPVDGVISSRYGKQRYINGVKRSPHLALDIAAPEGTNIIAPANGVVVLTDNFFYSGNIIVIDHGMGLFTSYSHLHKISVEVGEMVKSGHALGEVGSTGRVTGPHLHWSVYLTSTRINPENILKFKILNSPEFIKN